MKNMTVALVLYAVLAMFFVATAGELDQATKVDIARHRVMAQAHENAAKCLQSGKADAVCEKQLLAECKGLAIGKFCGMKHTH